MRSGRNDARERRARGRAAAALLERRELRALAAIAKKRTISCWIVGGAPRDLLLGRPELDVDVAVSAEAEQLAAELAERGFGTAVVLSDSPRVVRVAGSTILDIAELEGASIETDLARRDFTANAMAISFAGGDWIDPFGGIADVANRRLALVEPENLARDPLRTFRAARLFATHGLEPDRDVERAARRYAPGLARVAPERVALELARMLDADRVAPALRWAIRTGVLSPALRIEAAPAAWRRAAAALERLDVAAIRALPAERRRRLRLAALAGSLGFAPSAAGAWARSRRQSRAEAGALQTLLSLAQRATDLSRGDAAWTWIRDAGAALPDALRLAGALEPTRARALERLRRLAAGRGAAPRVSGRDVLAWLGIEPGPRVGELLRELETAGLSGEVRGRREARRWLLERGSGARPLRKE